MKPITWRLIKAFVPVVIGIIIVGVAYWNYTQTPITLPVLNRLKFKLGVDLVGGTILVYELDPDKKPENYNKDQLVAALKRRLDPADLYNITIRPLSDTRVEIILATGGRHRTGLQEKVWQDLLAKVEEKWGDKVKGKLEARRGDKAALTAEVTRLTGANPSEVDEYITKNYAGEKHKELTGNDVEQFKDLIQRVGSLEFRILANRHDDPDAVNAAEEYFKAAADSWHRFIKEQIKTRFPEVEKVTDKDKRSIDDVEPGDLRTVEELIRARDKKASADDIEQFLRTNYKPSKELLDLTRRAVAGQPPPAPEGTDGKTFKTELEGEPKYTYSWVEIGKNELHSLDLNNDAKESKEPKEREAWHAAAEARGKGKLHRLSTQNVDKFEMIVYSRTIPNKGRLGPKDRDKEYEYFLLTRNTEPGKEITGEYLTSAKQEPGERGEMAVAFRFNARGGNLFYELTNLNKPEDKSRGEGRRHLAIILDGQVMSAPTLNAVIRDAGQITGKFTKDEIDALITILRSGALPATLKSKPVSENTMGATLGDDTIRAGTRSVVISFLVVLAFMVAYYRFAGLVASIALLANLILTIAFMVMVSATFTLPGLAGLVLSVAMAVDANVLIYERLREERDRGASLTMAIRNGYDRSFATIIDTHLSCIFTGIVLYAVGNDQLKGFSISLVVGLIISLFTSLYITRALFDFWLSKGWLTKLSMGRLFSRTRIDFMKMRYVFFTASVALTLLGAAVFLLRGRSALNMDFVGGTVYTGQLRRPLDITEMRRLLSDEERQKQRLALKEDPTPKGDDAFELVYADGGETRTVQLAEKVTPEEVRRRAEELPEISLELLFKDDPEVSEGNASRLFTVRTTEKSPELVAAALNRLLVDDRGGQLLQTVGVKADVIYETVVTFDQSLKPEEARARLEKALGKDVGSISVTGKEEDRKAKGQYPTFAVDVSGGVPGPKLRDDLKKVKDLKGWTVNRARLDLSAPAYIAQVKSLLDRQFRELLNQSVNVSEARGAQANEDNQVDAMEVALPVSIPGEDFVQRIARFKDELGARPLPLRLENFDSQLAADTQARALYAILASWLALLFYVWFRFGNWTFGLAAILCLVHDVVFTLGLIAMCHYVAQYVPWLANALLLRDFKIDLPAVAALLTLVGYSINDKIVVYDRMREVRGKKPELTPEIINDSINQALSRTVLTGLSVLLVLLVLYIFGGEGIHLFAFVMLIGLIVGTYSSIYVASPLLLIFGEGAQAASAAQRERERAQRVSETEA